MPAESNSTTDDVILRGLRVVEFPAFIAAPLGGLTLAQLGAEVIRVDPIGGNIDIGRWPLNAQGRSLYWASLNRGKRSVEIDVRKPEGRRLLEDSHLKPPFSRAGTAGTVSVVLRAINRALTGEKSPRALTIQARHRPESSYASAL